MGETGWPAVSYRRLLDFMRRPETAKPLRHAAALDPAALERIAALPAGLIETGLARPDLTPAGLAILQECFEALAERDGLDRAAALAQPWSKAKSVRALFNRVKDELLADFPPLPFAATPRLRWLTCKSEMLEAAQRYRNCLSRYLNDASAGHRVFGEWLEGPGATFEVGRDEVFGWRLTQARGMGNSHLSDTAYEALGVDLRGLGIRVGHSGGALRRVAGYAAYGWDLRGQFYDQAVVFGDDGYQHPLEDIDLDI
jgi:hypothetical protein